MKKIFNILLRKSVKAKTSQRDLVEFVKDRQNIERAAEGSMQKRIDLIERVNLIKKNA